MMTTAQSTAFEEGTGSFFTAADFLLVVQSIGATLMFLYVAWIILRAYTDFGREFTKSRDMIGTWLRAVFMMMIFLYLFVN
jgi:integrating conjugative element protein (TIGR03758 family)